MGVKIERRCELVVLDLAMRPTRRFALRDLKEDRFEVFVHVEDDFVWIGSTDSGDATGRKLLDAEGKLRPQDSLIHGVFIPLVAALSSLQKGDGPSAIAVLEPARQYELAGFPPNAPYWILYVRGRAYLQSKQADRAAAEFQKILDFRGRDATSELIPLSQLQIARTYALQNDSAKARTAYRARRRGAAIGTTSAHCGAVD